MKEHLPLWAKVFLSVRFTSFKLIKMEHFCLFQQFLVVYLVNGAVSVEYVKLLLQLQLHLVVRYFGLIQNVGTKYHL